MIVFSSMHPLILFSFLRYKSAVIDSLLFIIDPLCLYSHSFFILVYIQHIVHKHVTLCKKPQDCTTNDPLCNISIVTPASAILTANVRFRASSDTHY